MLYAQSSKIANVDSFVIMLKSGNNVVVVVAVVFFFFLDMFITFLDWAQVKKKRIFCEKNNLMEIVYSGGQFAYYQSIRGTLLPMV